MWRNYILKDEIEKKCCIYSDFKDKCSKDVLKINVEKLAFAIVLFDDREFKNFLTNYLYENKDFVIKRIKESEDEFIPFERGCVLSFLKCQTEEDIKKFLTSSCGSMLRDFLSIIFCSLDVYELSLKEVEDMLKDEKDILDNETYKEVFIYELTSLIKERPGYLNKV